MKYWALGFLLFSGSAFAQASAPRPQRIIVFVLDDVGADSLAQISTPNIDALAAGGVHFTRAYSHPWCKPSRDSLLRGSWDGVARGESCNPSNGKALSANAPNFVSSLKTAGYLTGLIGKWHVGRAQSSALPWWFAPHAVGFDHWWAGTSASIVGNCNPGGANTFDDGVFSQTMKQATVLQRDRLFDLIDEADMQGKPLFAWVGFTDAHSPWSLPSRSILPPGYMLPVRPKPRDYFEAEVVSLDFVIGQVAARLTSSDWIIVMSENGTPEPVIKPFGRPGKSSIYEGGVRVPLVFSGGGLGPRTIQDPVQLYDIGATLLSNLGLPGPRGKGRDILGPSPQNPFAFVMNPTQSEFGRAVIERRYKLLNNSAGTQFYDLLVDPGEQSPLPLAGPDFRRLKQLLAFLPGA